MSVKLTSIQLREFFFWMDDNGNMWRKPQYSKDDAIKASEGLRDCYLCVDCESCTNSRRCAGCRNMLDCFDCTCCYECTGCQHCQSCRRCSLCSNCDDCFACRLLTFSKKCNYSGSDQTLPWSCYSYLKNIKEKPVAVIQLAEGCFLTCKKGGGVLLRWDNNDAITKYAIRSLEYESKLEALTKGYLDAIAKLKDGLKAKRGH